MYSFITEPPQPFHNERDIAENVTDGNNKKKQFEFITKLVILLEGYDHVE